MGEKAELEALDLAALLCSRVCHDIISPVGAITNGLEVLDEDNSEEMKAFAFDLIRRSARQASAKLQFARLAFNHAAKHEVIDNRLCILLRKFIRHIALATMLDRQRNIRRGERRALAGRYREEVRPGRRRQAHRQRTQDDAGAVLSVRGRSPIDCRLSFWR